MTKENRAELKALRARLRTLSRDARKAEGTASNEVHRLIRETEKTLAGIRKEAASIERRRLILTGRAAK